MHVSEAPLLSQWSLLEEEVLPRLEGAARPSEGPTVWADGDMRDAVAVAVAFELRIEPREKWLQAFVTAGRQEPPAVRYSMSEIRGLPVRARREAFRRCAQGWIPAESIAERVYMGRPPGGVDLLVVRASRERVCDRRPYSSLVRPGGHVLVIGDPPERLSADRQLERVAGSGFFQRVEGAVEPPEESVPVDEQASVRTLAKKLLEEELVARHLNLARGLARRFSGHGEPVDDLRQVAFVGLVLAARRYDPAQNASFSTYATATILGELKRYFRDKSWMMRVPRNVQETYLAIKTAREELYQELACSPTIDQIARRLRISEEAVLEAMEAGDNFLPQSLDSGPDEDSPGRDVPVVDRSFDVMLERTLLVEAIPRLSRREQLVLKRVYLDGWTQRKVAQEIGVSQMQVSRLLHASAQKIRSYTGS